MDDFEIGDRVQVLGKKAKGKVAFIGTTHFSEGQWYGVALDEPEGRNNGIVDGMKYFRCKRDHGVFVRKVQLERENEIQKCVDNQPQKPKCVVNPRVVYPNYLRRSSQASLTKKHRSKSREIKSEKDVPKSSLPLYHLEKDVLHLKESVKSKNDELGRLKSEKEASEIRLKLMQENLKEKCEQLENTEQKVRYLEKDLSTRKAQVNTLKKELKRLRTALADLQRTRDSKDEECKQLMEIAEYTTIEKEMAEVKYEELEIEFKEAKDKCDQLQVELEISREEIELDNINGAPNTKYVKELEEQNRVMKNGLMCLKTYYTESKEENLMREKMIKENLEEIKGLNETKDKLKELVEVYKHEIGDLQETVDGAAAAEEIICSLSEKNFILEKKIDALEGVLKDANELLEVNNELEEVLQDLERDYREELDSYRVKILNIQKVLSCALQVVTENGTTIAKYRELTFQLKAANSELTNRLKQIDEERKVALVASETMKLRVRAKQDDDSRKVMRVENLQIDVNIAKEKLNYWSAYLPDAFLSQSAEHKAIETMLMISKLKMKVDALSTKIEENFPVSEEGLLSITESKVDELTFLTEFMSKLCYLQNLFRNCETAMQHCSVDKFLDTGKHHEEIHRLCKKTDSHIELYSKDGLNNKDALGIFDDAIEIVRNLFGDQINSSDLLGRQFWVESYTKLICVFCDCIRANISRLKILTENAPGLVFESLLIDATREVDIVRKHAKSSLENITSFENNMQLNVDSEIRDNLKQTGGFMVKAMNSIVSTRQHVSLLDSDMNLEEPCDWMRDAAENLKFAVTQLDKFLHLLQTGECLSEQSAEPSYYPAVYQRALQKKHEGVELMKNLRRQLESSGQDLIRMMKDFQEQSRELDDVKRSNVIARKIENPKIDNFTTFSETEASMLKIQLQDFKHTVRFLREENFRLQCHNVKSQLSDLKSLILAPARKNPPCPEVDEIRALESKASRLAKEVHEIILPTVVDISKPGNDAKMTLVKRKMLILQVEDKLDKLKAEISDYKTSSCFQSFKTNSQKNVYEGECTSEFKMAALKEEEDKRLKFYTHVDEEKLQKLRSLIARKNKKSASSITLC